MLPLTIHAWLARRLATPDFQQLAIRLPVIRRIARRRARALFSLSTGFVHSQVLLATLRTGVLDALRDEPRRLDTLARALDLSADRLGRLLDAAAVLRLVHRRGDVVVLGDLGAVLLGNPAARAMIEHHDALYRDLAEPGALLEAAAAAAPASRTARLWRYAGTAGSAAPTSDPAVSAGPDARDGGAAASEAAAQSAAYSTLMTRSQDMIATEVLGVLPLARRRRLLDVGGGEGAFAIAAARRHVHLQVTTFDLPAVAAAARQAVRRAGLEKRVAVRDGSFFTDPLPRDADALTLVRVLHDHDDLPALELLRACRAALPPGALLAVAEPLAGEEPAVDAYFAVYFLAMGQGRLRTPAEVRTLLERAGFRGVRRLPTRLPLLTGVITANAA